MEAIMPAVSDFLREQRVDPKAAYAVSLTLEEVITNIVKYAYSEHGDHNIDVTLAVDDGAVLVDFQDDGNEFDPRDFPEPDTTQPVEKRTAGGLGIHLVRKMSESMKYRRENGKNVLEIKILRQME